MLLVLGIVPILGILQIYWRHIRLVRRHLTVSTEQELKLVVRFVKLSGAFGFRLSRIQEDP